MDETGILNFKTLERFKSKAFVKYIYCVKQIERIKKKYYKFEKYSLFFGFVFSILTYASYFSERQVIFPPY